MLRWLQRYAGLERPFAFERVLILAWAATLAAFVLVAVGALIFLDELNSGSPREQYFVYLGLLILLGVLLPKYPRLAACVLSLATIDFSLGLGSFAMEEVGLAKSSVLPGKYDDPPRFEWHSLLQATPIPSIQRNVVHLKVSHSSERTRGRNHDSDDLAKKIVIATFGGSTTYDVSVSDDETWSSRLEGLLGAEKHAVINHGVLGYTTAEHLIQTAFYQVKFGVAPHCAVYYIGWNDIRNAHIPRLDPGYADFHLPSQVDGLKVRRVGPSYTSISPLLTIIGRLASLELDTIKPPRELNIEPQAGGAPALEKIFVSNVRAISAINRSRGIKSIWISQVLNSALYANDGLDGWIPLVRNKDVLPLLERFNDLLRIEANQLGDVYINVSSADFSPSDFRDNGHFLPAGSLKFARLIAPQVAEACR